MQNGTEILRPPQAAKFLGITVRHLYNLAERDPKFPRKIVFSKRCVGFRRESLNAYILEKESEV